MLEPLRIILLLVFVLSVFARCKNENDPCGLEVSIQVISSDAARAVVSYGQEPYSYQWSDGQQTMETDLNPQNGNHSVTVTDDLGCTATATLNLACGTTTNVTDSEGNSYRTIGIGTRCWLVKNLKSTAGITEVADSAAWNRTTPAWCYYENKIANNDVYGKLYNWYALTLGNNPCPNGWHVATNNDWLDLVNAAGGYTVAGGTLKSTEHWMGSNIGATDSLGFSAVGSSFRTAAGIWDDVPHQTAVFWTATEKDSTSAWGWTIHSNVITMSQIAFNKSDGYSCRCVKD